jgi:hypothetical protein
MTVYYYIIIIIITIKIRILDYSHRPCVYFYKFTTFRRLALSPSSGEEDKEEGRFGLYEYQK